MLLRPPCVNNTSEKIYVLVSSLAAQDIIDYFIGKNKSEVESTVFRYFEGRKMDAEEDSDVLEILPSTNMYMLELTDTTPKEVQNILLRHENIDQTMHYDISGANEEYYIFKYGKLLEKYNYLDYFDIPD